ncbi:GH21042 [Drosophila grimshawi]|uniref:GH21042 n=1 Tax=Drosophila grimshawi TaxID=7222 RepID=B4JRM5_DROGR|nr:GH21042 [Drosophila grimshawi]
MLAFYSILVLLSLLPVGFQLDTYLTPTPQEAGPSQIIVVNDIIKKVHKERVIEMLLVMNRRQDINCPLRDINPLELPTLRLDEERNITIKRHFNRKILALVCLSELPDTRLLSALADNLHRMRETPIIILLNSVASNLTKDLQIICETTANYNFIHLIVLHLTSNRIEESIVTYRLQPFPSPTLERIRNISDGHIFPKMWLNFKGKTALFLPDLSMPRSMLATDPRTGEQKLCGSSDRLILEFVKARNIQLQFLRPLENLTKIDNTEILNLTSSGKIDISPKPYTLSIKEISSKVEPTHFTGFVDVLILVPCGQEMSIRDVYTGLKTYSIIVLGAYFIFAVIETLIVASINWIFRRRPYLIYSPLVLNMRAFAGVLGLPMPPRRNRTSLSLQQIVIIMSIFSLVFSCFFNANLSTLLTKHPQNKQIQNLKELRDSGLPIKTDKSAKMNMENAINAEFLKNVLPNSEYLSNKEFRKLLFTLNSSYGYQTFTTAWNVIDKYQRYRQQNVLCTSSGLHVSKNIPTAYVLKKNSIFRQAFDDFINLTWSYGLINYWIEQAKEIMIHLAFAKETTPNNQESKITPLNIEDLKWLWKLLGVCYSLAGLVFMVEKCVAYLQRKRFNRKIYPNV